MAADIAVIMGSKSDLPSLKGAFDTLKKFGLSFEARVLSAHRTPDAAAEYAKNAEERGIKIIICAAGMAAHLGGVIAAHTILPVIGIPMASEPFHGWDALLAMVQMPPGIPVATVAINGAMNAGILAVQILAVGDRELKEKMIHFKESLKKKIVDANKELAAVKYNFKTN